MLQVFDENVVEIREQFPLLFIETTQFIAKEFGIRHPAIRSDDIVMTTDFLLTIREDNIYKDIVRTIKPSENITQRTLEKFKIEEEFFKRRYEDDNFDWGVVTEKEINIIKALNISNLFDYYNWDKSMEIKSKLLKRMIDFFKSSLINNKRDIEGTIAKFSEKYNYKKT